MNFEYLLRVYSIILWMMEGSNLIYLYDINKFLYINHHIIYLYILHFLLCIYTKMCISTGADPEGAHPARAPPKIGKNKICLRKIVIFHTKYPKNFRASLRSAQFF